MKITINYIYFIVIPFLLLFNNGCTKVGPDFQKLKDHKLPSSWENNITKNDTNITQWWKLFNDETLNKLVDKTYEQNLDLKSAGLRILQARAILGASKGLIFPQSQYLSAGVSDIRDNGNSFGVAGVNFDVGWEMDVWGKYARGIESSEATLYASIASYDDILVSIISEVARNYINFRTSQERIAFAKRNISIQKRVTKMTEIQYNAGNVSELDMQQAKTQLYTTKSALPGLILSMIKSRNAIAVLLGTIPQEIDSILMQETTSNLSDVFQTKDFKNNSCIPVALLDDNISIDANLIRRRPDIQIAELQAKAQNAKIGASKAELYPHFSLLGNIGYNTNNAQNGWISAGDAIGISVGPAFRWNILQYSRIKNQVRFEDALFQESINNYNKKVLLAVEEVSNALNGYKLTKKQLELNAKAVDATIRAFNISMIQYNNGLVTYQRLFSTVEKLTQNEDIYAKIKGNIAIQVITLYKALGGGWQKSIGNSYISKEDIKQMSERTDWGEYFDNNSTILQNGDKY